MENCTDKIFFDLQIEKFQNSNLKRKRDNESEIQDEKTDPSAKRRTNFVESSENNSNKQKVDFDDEDWDDVSKNI